MRSRWWKLAASAAALLFVTSSAGAAEDVQNDVRELRDMVLQLQDRMEAQQATIESQRRVLEDAGLQEGAKSALSSFLESTEFSGWVAASYNYNVNGDSDRQRGQNAGRTGLSNPFHPDANTFAMDQLWFELDKDVSSESRGGFHADLLFGKTATLYGGNGGAGNDGFEVFTAYASYLAPIGDGVRIEAGELPTLIGAEVVQSPYNFNITRGLVWTLQPVTHTGVIASTDIGPATVAVGAVNDIFSDTDRDRNPNKAVTASVGMGGDTFAGSVNFIWGTPTNSRKNTGQRGGILDAVLSADVGENLSMWYNFDWIFTRGGVPDSDSFANALAARLALTDDFGVAVRGEYLVLEAPGSPGGPFYKRVDLWSVTGTLDYRLAEGLTLRGEVRYDDGDTANLFRGNDDRSFAFREDEQVLLLAEMIYQF
jgi:hypothetical protein